MPSAKRPERRVLSSFFTTVVCVFAASTASAQTDQTITIEGCLTPGPQAGRFILTEDATGNAVTITGLGELAQHTGNHRERIFGRYAENDLFVVERAEHLADACQPLYERVSDRVQELVDDLRRKAALGVRVGVGLDPELMLLGLHAEFATGVEDLLFRPNVEFGLGEVTAEYAANAEAVYRIPFSRESGDGVEIWNVYVGGGPSFTVFNQEFRERDFNDTSSRPDDELFTFDDRDSVFGFNVLVGIAKQNGFFVEMKAGAYGNPAARVLLGFTF